MFWIKKQMSYINNKNGFKEVLSDHFDNIKSPVSVSLGLHLNGQTVEDVVNLLRKGGINAVPYYDERIKDDLSCFVVDGTGIRSPFFKKTKDAIRATTDMFKIMNENKIETSRAMPITKDNLIEAVSQGYTGNIIDVAKNNPNEGNVDNTLSSYLRYAVDKMPKIDLPREDSRQYTSKTHIYRGGFLGDRPYALTFHRRYRDCAYGTNRITEALTYSQAANKVGLHYKEIDGISYGFVYGFKQKKRQKFYDMAGAERPFASPEEKQTANRPEYRSDYETLILKDRNPLSAVYLRVNDKLVQIADEKGYFKTEGMDWGMFARLHRPRNTSELNDYLVTRMNRQINEFQSFEYKKEGKSLIDTFRHGKKTQSLGKYDKELNIYGLTFRDKVKDTSEGVEISGVRLNSLTISDSINKVRLSGNLNLNNCALSPSLQALNASNCTGDICMTNMEYMNIVLPEQCESFALSQVKLKQGDVLDLSKMKCKKMVLEDVDLSAVKSVILPKGLEEVKLKYGVKFPENINFNDAKNVVFTRSAKPDYSKTKQIMAPDNTRIEVENTTDKEELKSKLKNESVNISTRKQEPPVSSIILEKTGRSSAEPQKVAHIDNNQVKNNKMQLNLKDIREGRNSNF